jgi:hypothetical protein
LVFGLAEFVGVAGSIDPAHARINLVGGTGNLGVRLGWREAIAPARSFAERVRSFGVRSFAQSTLCALDSALQG